MTVTRSYTVTDADAGRRALATAMDRWPLAPEARLREMFRAGEVRVNGEAVSHKEPLRKGDVLELPPGAADLRPEASVEIEVVHDDEALVAVSKPLGCTVVRERWDDDCPFMESVLAWILKNHGPERVRVGFRPRPVHRLDRDTTGLVLVALTPEAEKDLCGQFRERTLEKEYLALVAGAPTDDEGEIDAAIEEHPYDPKRMRIAAKRRGKPAVTRFEVAERFRGYTLVRCFPKTGRRHQVRLHMALAGAPILGDDLYGGGEALYLSSFKRGYRPKAVGHETPLIGRYALHAFAIRFAHPTQGEIRLEAPPPKDFAVALKALRRWGEAR